MNPRDKYITPTMFELLTAYCGVRTRQKPPTVTTAYGESLPPCPATGKPCGGLHCDPPHACERKGFSF